MLVKSVEDYAKGLLIIDYKQLQEIKKNLWLLRGNKFAKAGYP
ncbi:hypothetical protein UF75_3442 [Desulfosporosinus sp. I2]|nr:hypothetical protein UF75_3442 [Desulfosporosinus sp. I2]